MNGYERIVLSDGNVLFGHKDEYISNMIRETGDYYEIIDLKKFEKYIPFEPVVYDIGSNIGNHTLYFSKKLRAKKIYAFEPVVPNINLLNMNIKENNLKNVEVLPVAVGSRRGRTALSINERNMGECKLIENEIGNTSIVTINELDLDTPDFVKIDVEGAEVEVLKGMSEILSKDSPVIWIETSDNFLKVDQFLLKYQYELVDAHNFNFIYMKYNTLDNRLSKIQTFKENIILEYKNTTIDKWNLNRWLRAEKNKVRQLEVQIESINNLMEEQKKEISRINQENSRNQEMYEVMKAELENKNAEIEKIRYRYEIEKQEIRNKILSHIEMERRALLELKRLQEHYRIMESRYYRMKNSLPGKVAVKLWRIVKRFR